MGSSFHQPGTVNENVLESDFVPLCDGTMRRHSLADLRLLEGMYFVIREWKQAGAKPVVVLYASINVLNFVRVATGSQCREIKRGVTCFFGGFAEDQSCRCILNHL